MIIRLKKKYRSAYRGRYNGGENYAPKKHRHKIGYDQHVKIHGTPPKTTMIVDGRTGRGVFITDYS